MATAAYALKYSGGTCYAMCQDVFSWYRVFEIKIIIKIIKKKKKGIMHRPQSVGRDAIMEWEE